MMVIFRIRGSSRSVWVGWLNDPFVSPFDSNSTPVDWVVLISRVCTSGGKGVYQSQVDRLSIRHHTQFANVFVLVRAFCHDLPVKGDARMNPTGCSHVPE